MMGNCCNIMSPATRIENNLDKDMMVLSKVEYKKKKGKPYQIDVRYEKNIPAGKYILLPYRDGIRTDFCVDYYVHHVDKLYQTGSKITGKKVYDNYKVSIVKDGPEGFKLDYKECTKYGRLNPFRCLPWAYVVPRGGRVSTTHGNEVVEN